MKPTSVLVFIVNKEKAEHKLDTQTLLTSGKMIMFSPDIIHLN